MKLSEPNLERGMMRNGHLIASVIALVAGLGLAGSAEAGTCISVNAKGMGKNIAKATTAAQVNLHQKVAGKGGKVTQTSTNCVPGSDGYLCKISAVVCPK